VQAVGRALRPAPNKPFGYVIVPILHDADATADDIFKSPAFKEILTTLRALAANDDRIIEYFRGVSKGQQRKGGGSVQFDIDERLAKRINLDDFAREIELKCWDRLAKLSWRPFEEAREFVRTLRLRSASEWRKHFVEGVVQKGSRPISLQRRILFMMNGLPGVTGLEQEGLQPISGNTVPSSKHGGSLVVLILAAWRNGDNFVREFCETKVHCPQISLPSLITDTLTKAGQDTPTGSAPAAPAFQNPLSANADTRAPRHGGSRVWKQQGAADSDPPLRMKCQ
jgi:hypothetical protein